MEARLYSKNVDSAVDKKGDGYPIFIIRLKYSKFSPLEKKVSQIHLLCCTGLQNDHPLPNEYSFIQVLRKAQKIYALLKKILIVEMLV